MRTQFVSVAFFIGMCAIASSQLPVDTLALQAGDRISCQMEGSHIEVFALSDMDRVISMKDGWCTFKIRMRDRPYEGLLGGLQEGELYRGDRVTRILYEESRISSDLVDNKASFERFLGRWPFDYAWSKGGYIVGLDYAGDDLSIQVFFVINNDKTAFMKDSQWVVEYLKNQYVFKNVNSPEGPDIQKISGETERK